MKKETAMQQLIDWINQDYRTQIEVEEKAKELLQIEFEQIRDAWCDGDDNGHGTDAIKYFYSTYKEFNKYSLTSKSRYSK